MKPRRVVLSLELETALPLAQLAAFVRIVLQTAGVRIEQLQANAIRRKK